MIDLMKYDSHCSAHQSIIVSQDRGRCKHYAINRKGAKVRKYYIDGEVICSGVRCDRLVLNDDSLEAYYIELKGSDIIQAIKQVEETKRVLSESLPRYVTFYRIIYKSGSHRIRSSKVNEWKDKCGRDSRTGKQYAIVKCLEYEEII